MQIERCSYFVPLNQTKINGENLNQKDLINVGYLAGKCGINLEGNPYENNKPEFVKDGVKLNINSCTVDLFEKELTKSGINFDILA